MIYKYNINNSEESLAVNRVALALPTVRMMLKLFFVIFISFLSYRFVFSAEKSCAQYGFKVNYIKNCGGKGSALMIHNLTFSLTDDCHIIPKGCYQVKKKISDIKVNYHVSKPPLFNKNGTEDMCKAMADEKFQKMIGPYKVDTKCPIEAGNYCLAKGSTYVEQLNPATLNMAVGVLRARAEMTSEKSKSKSCIEMEAVISKKKH